MSGISFNFIPYVDVDVGTTTPLPPPPLKRPTTSQTRPETTYNDRKRPTTSQKRSEMTCNDLKRPTMSKKRPETAYNKQEMTYNDLRRTDSNFMELLYLKNNQLEGLSITKKP